MKTSGARRFHCLALRKGCLIAKSLTPCWRRCVGFLELLTPPLHSTLTSDAGSAIRWVIAARTNKRTHAHSQTHTHTHIHTRKNTHKHTQCTSQGYIKNQTFITSLNLHNLFAPTQVGHPGGQVDWEISACPWSLLVKSPQTIVRWLPSDERSTSASRALTQPAR